MKRISSLSFFLGVAAVIALADQFIKWVVMSSFKLGESLVIIPGFLNLVYYRNRGGAFSLLSDLPPVWGQVFFVVATAGALVFVFYLFRYKPPESNWGRLSLPLIFGGGIGNLVDRVAYGEVIDFVLFYYNHYYWPAFNLADSCITVGVVLLAVDIFLEPGSNSVGDQETG